MPIDVIRSKIVVAGLSYLQPVFEAQYTQIRVVAEVTMPDFLGVEIITPADLVYLTPEKNFSDGTSSSDIFSRVPEKGLFEGLIAVDSIYTTLIYIRAYEEFIDSPDFPALMAILPKADGISTASANALSFEKNLANAVSIVDMMDGNIQYDIIKVLSEMPLLSDVQIIDFNTQKADNIATQSGGVLSMQDYSDITYFLEDYVGLTRTLT